jgi:cytoskeletal protein CcmA (bactofilin family)
MSGSSPLEDRGLSSVIGVVLLIGIAVMVMAVLAVSVLGGGMFEVNPDADLVYVEDPSGEVTIAVEGARGLTAGDTRISLRNGGDCRGWPGTGDVEAGDTVEIDSGDCSFGVGDTLQVIGSSTLVDTYEVRGVSGSWDYNCAVDGPLTSTPLADSNDVTIDTGDTIKCDFTDPGEDRNFDIDSGSTLIGDISSSDGDFDLDNGKVDGYVEANGDDVTVTGGSTITDYVSTDGNVDIDGGSTIQGPVTSGGTVNLDNGNVDGYVDADSDVSISGATVGDLVYTNGNIDIDSGSTIDGAVLATGNINAGSSSTIDGTVYHTGNVDPTSIQASHDGIVELDDQAALADKRDDLK